MQHSQVPCRQHVGQGVPTLNRSSVSTLRWSRKPVMPSCSDNPKNPRVISSRASEAAAISNQFKRRSAATSHYDYLQYLDTEARISVQIASAQTINELSSILATGNYVDSLHNSHISAFVAAMPRTLHNQLIGQSERLSVQRMLKQLNTLASMYLHRFQPAEIVAMLEGWAQLRALDARLQAADPILASLLVDLLCGGLEELPPSQLAAATWAIGHLGVPLQAPALAPLLSALQRHLTRLAPEDHIRMAQGLAAVGCPLPRSWCYDWQLRTVELPGLTPPQAAALLSAAVQLPVLEHGDATEWVDAMLAKTRGGLAGLPMPVLADTLTAVAKLSQPGSVQPGWINEFLCAVAAALFGDAAEPWGGQGDDGPVMMHIPTLPAVTPQELAALAAALGTLGLQPRPQWMEAFLRIVGFKLPSFGSEELAALLWGLAMLDCRPDADWMQQCIAEAECRLPGLDIAHASKITWALGMMSCSRD